MTTARSLANVVAQLTAEFPGRRSADLEEATSRACLALATVIDDAETLAAATEWFARARIAGSV